MTNEILTIGYEGKTISDFIRQLCSREVKAILDVRANPIRMNVTGVSWSIEV